MSLCLCMVCVKCCFTDGLELEVMERYQADEAFIGP